MGQLNSSEHPILQRVRKKLSKNRKQSDTFGTQQGGNQIVIDQNDLTNIPGLNVESIKDVVQRILYNFNQIEIFGVAGGLSVYGPNAYPIVTGSSWLFPCDVPVIAAATYGDGKILVYAHNSYNTDAINKSQAVREFITARTLPWLSGKMNTASSRIACLNCDNLSGSFRFYGFNAIKINSVNELSNHSYDVLYLIPRQLTDQQIAIVLNFVARGGGLVVAECLWGYMQLNKGINMFNYPGNKLLQHVGIQFNDSCVSSSNDRFITSSVPSPLCHGYYSLLNLERHWKGEIKLSDNDLKNAAETMNSVMYNLPLDDHFILPMYKKYFSETNFTCIPTDQQKITEKNIKERLSLAFHVMYNKRIPAEQVTAHPAFQAFPGIVHPHASRVSKKIKVDTSIKDWHSTGLYAAAGELVTVYCPQVVVNKNIYVQIGCHTDQLFSKNEWARAPDICRSFYIDASIIKIANSFGGLIYINVSNDQNIGTHEFVIENAVEAPLFILGTTDIQEWKQKIRYLPAPWTEFQTRTIIISVPTSYAKNIEDPQQALNLWDAGMSYCTELAGKAYYQKRPARLVTDVQISAGYMHSGYPIMTHLDQATNDQLLNPKNLIKNWGLWHEIGHNNQNDDWTFEGTVEVTVNIFTIFTIYRFHNNTWNVLREKFSKDHGMDAKLQKFASCPSFDLWKSDPFIGLWTYRQLIEAFGFESFKKMFRIYLQLSDNERPKHDQQKRDQWMVRFSQLVGKNLGPFFDWWQIPISSQAKQLVSNLPIWLPELPKVSYYQIMVNNSGKVLTIPNRSKENGAIVQQADWHNLDNQIFILQSVPNDPGYYFITCKDSLKSLDVGAFSHDNGVHITQWESNNGDNQRFWIDNIQGELSVIRVKHSGKVLTVVDDGTVQQWDWKDKANQKFRIVQL